MDCYELQGMSWVVFWESWLEHGPKMGQDGASWGQHGDKMGPIWAKSKPILYQHLCGLKCPHKTNHRYSNICNTPKTTHVFVFSVLLLCVLNCGVSEVDKMGANREQDTAKIKQKKLTKDEYRAKMNKKRATRPKQKRNSSRRGEVCWNQNVGAGCGGEDIVTGSRRTELKPQSLEHSYTFQVLRIL
jgi:hypothetical protein